MTGWLGAKHVWSSPWLRPLQARPVPSRTAGRFRVGATVGENGVQGGQLPEFRRYRGLETTAVFTQAVIPITQPEALRGYVYTISGVLAAFCPH